MLNRIKSELTGGNMCPPSFTRSINHCHICAILYLVIVIRLLDQRKRKNRRIRQKEDDVDPSCWIHSHSMSCTRNQVERRVSSARINSNSYSYRFYRVSMFWSISPSAPTTGWREFHSPVGNNKKDGSEQDWSPLYLFFSYFLPFRSSYSSQSAC